MYFTVSLLVLAAPGAGASRRQVGAGDPVSTSVRAGKAFLALQGARVPFPAVRRLDPGRAGALRCSGAPLSRWGETTGADRFGRAVERVVRGGRLFAPGPVGRRAGRFRGPR